MRKSFEEVINNRKSVRNFSKRRVPAEKIRQILFACMKIPSAGGMKSFVALKIEDKPTKQKLADASYGQEFIAKAPIVFVFLALPKLCSQIYKERGQLYATQDATIACTYAMLSAQAQGLSTCWVGAFSPKEVMNITVTNKDCLPIALLTVGYKAHKVKEKGKLTTIQEANLSPGFRKFRKQFICQCAKCGSNACVVMLIIPKKTAGILNNYGKLRFGFKCIECGNEWLHAYDLKLYDQKFIERQKNREEEIKRL